MKLTLSFLLKNRPKLDLILFFFWAADTESRTLDVGVCSILIDPIVFRCRSDSWLPWRELSGDGPKFELPTLWYGRCGVSVRGKAKWIIDNILRRWKFRKGKHKIEKKNDNVKKQVRIYIWKLLVLSMQYDSKFTSKIFYGNMDVILVSFLNGNQRLAYRNLIIYLWI